MVYLMGLPFSSVTRSGSPVGLTSSTLILRNFPSRAALVGEYAMEY
jgi:hypothetical protein